MEKKINKKQITSVELEESTECTSYVYKKEINIKFFGFQLFFSPAGFYQISMGRTQILDEDRYKKDLYKVDEKLFYKPTVIITTSDREVHKKYFDDLDSAKNYKTELTNSNDYIKIEKY